MGYGTNVLCGGSEQHIMSPTSRMRLIFPEGARVREEDSTTDELFSRVDIEFLFDPTARVRKYFLFLT